MDGSWDDLNRRLLGALIALDLDDALIIGDTPVSKGRKGLFGFRPTQGARRYVRITAARDVLIAECVGSTSFGGEWAMTPETEEALLRQGWDKPWSEEYRTFSRDAPLSSAPRLAFATVRALQTLGCEMSGLDVELVHEESG